MVPTGNARAFDFPGRGRTDHCFRKEILLHYHNGPLGGHQGQEWTMDALARDFWWPGMYGDVRRWYSTCEFCRGEHGGVRVDTHGATLVPVSCAAV